MSGEATARMIDLAVQGAARMAKRMQIVNDRFAAPGPASNAQRLSLEDAYAELDRAGHFYDPTCQSPFCTAARAMLHNAMLALQQEQAAAQGMVTNA